MTQPSLCIAGVVLLLAAVALQLPAHQACILLFPRPR
jgi:hypothetical protein